MSLPADQDLLHSAVVGDARPTAVFRTDGGMLRPVAVSRSMLAAMGVADDACVAAHFERLGGVETLAGLAESRGHLEVPGEGETRLVLSVRRLGEHGLQVRGIDAEATQVSNTLTANVIAGLSNNETGVIFLDPAGYVLAVNKAFGRFFPPTDVFPRIGGHLSDLVRGAIDAGYLPQASGQETRYVEGTVRHFMGETAEPLSVLSAAGRWITTSRMRFRNGAVAILLIDMTDIQRKLDQFRSFVRNTRGMVFVRKPAGERAAEIWGRDARRILGLASDGERVDVDAWRSTVDPRDADAYREAERLRQSHMEPYEIEFRFRHPVSGETRWLLENSWVSTDPASGEIHFDSFMIDITARKEAEAELRHSELRFQEFAEMAADWAFEADANMTLTWVSDSFRDVSGMSPSRYIGRSWAEITEAVLPGLPRDQVRAWNGVLEAWRARRRFRVSPLLFRFPGGNDRMVEVSGTPVFDRHGVYVGCRGIARDVTGLVRAREDARAAMRTAEAANRAKSEFIANMSHELRTPLNAIIGFGHVMENEMFGPVGNERYREYAADIAASGQHLLSLVNDILDLSRIEADRLKVDLEEVRVGPEVERVLALFRQTAGSRLLVSRVPGNCDALADRRLLRQMLINLVGNSVKFTDDDGEITVSVEEADGAIRVRVADDGIGMSAEDIETALEPFGRVAGSDIAGGTGLGLPLTRKLAELHGGSLLIESEPGKGTQITIELPQRGAAAHPGDTDRLTA